IIVISLELFNTAVEQLIDFLKPEKNPVIGQVKDMVAGGVLVATIGAITIGLIIFVPKIVDLISY
ncbi:diacylglycerol kinase, partial [Patescibacteria group bacterium]